MKELKTYRGYVKDALVEVRELLPWDLDDLIREDPSILLVDVRCKHEYDSMHISGSINVPRGILEPACEWGFEETVPELVLARENKVVLICRSGNRSILAAKTMMDMGFREVLSLKTGMKGWNDSEYPMVNGWGRPVSVEEGDLFFNKPVTKDKLGPLAKV